MRVSPDLDKILPALAEVKASMGVVLKSSSNPFFRSKYADLNAHLAVVEPLLAKSGLLLVQPVDNTVEGNLVESTIYHTATGQFISSSMRLVGGVDMQKLGSAVTYARRYTLGSLLGMVADDDDASVASGNVKPKSSSYKPKGSSNNKSAVSAASRPSFSSRAKTEPVEDTVGEDDGL